jgi:PAS domain S-box-containing protein
MTGMDDAGRTMRIALPAEGTRREQGDKAAVTLRGAGATSFIARRLATEDDRRTSDYKQLLESIYDGVMITDARGRVVDFNSRAIEFFMRNGSELAGMRITSFISGASEDLLDAIQRNLRDHRYTLIEGRCVRSDSSTFPAEIAVNRITIESGGHLCFLIRDITIRKKYQEDLEEAISRLEAHDRARSQFVSNVSHELRTPLTSMIYAVANMLRGVVGPVSDPVRRYLEMLQGDSKRLLATVNDILDLRKLETSTLVLEKARVPLGPLVRRSAGSLHVQAEQKSLRLEFDVPSEPWFVDCDPAKLERVMLNVVGNALKFTPEGGCVRIAARPDTSDGTWVVVTVKDTGIGIPPDALAKVTLRYFTVGEQPSGSGLGLAISKEIVDLHGGALQIASPPQGAEHGTEVTIRLPLSDGPQVVVVTSSDPLARRIETVLRREGYSVTVTAAVEDALAALRTDLKALAVVDWSDGRTEGTEVVMKLKANKRMMDVPVVGVTETPMSAQARQVVRTFSIPTLQAPWEDGALMEAVTEGFLG